MMLQGPPVTVPSTILSLSSFKIVEEACICTNSDARGEEAADIHFEKVDGLEAKRGFRLKVKLRVSC